MKHYEAPTIHMLEIEEIMEGPGLEASIQGITQGDTDHIEVEGEGDGSDIGAKQGTYHKSIWDD